jgi:hypothetical protein
MRVSGVYGPRNERGNLQFTEIWTGITTVHLVIDALDECPIATGLQFPHESVLKVIEELVNLQVHNLRICVTSQPEADILPLLEPLAFLSVILSPYTARAAKYTTLPNMPNPSFIRTVRCEDGRPRISNLSLMYSPRKPTGCE